MRLDNLIKLEEPADLDAQLIRGDLPDRFIEGWRRGWVDLPPASALGLDLLRRNLGTLHSRKLRSFDEPPFR